MEKVNKEEYNALNNFLKIKDGNLEKSISAYLSNSNKWTSDLNPLREMGLERFVRCCVNGYELDLNFDIDKSFRYEEYNDSAYLDLMWNCSFAEDLKDCPTPIYIGIGDGRDELCMGFTIEHAEKLKNDLIEMLDDLAYLRDMRDI